MRYKNYKVVWNCQRNYLIFFEVPPLLQPVEGGGSVKGGKRNSWRGKLSGEPGVNKEANKRATSLKAYRVEFIEPLTEYPGTENRRGEIKKSPIEFVLLCFKLFTITINAKKPLLSNWSLQRSGFWTYKPSTCPEDGLNLCIPMIPRILPPNQSKPHP